MSKSAIIKNLDVSSSFISTLGFVSESEKKGKQHGVRTRRELTDIRDQAREEGLHEGRSLGLSQGHLEGLQEGMIEGRRLAMEKLEAENQKALAAFTESLTRTVQGVENDMVRWCEEAEAALTDKVAEICRTVLTEELHLSRSSIVGIVREAMLEITHSRKARVRLNPFDAYQLQDRKAEILAATASIESLEIVEDASILGGCVIETEGGLIDASLETKLIHFQEELDDLSEAA